MTTDSVAFVVVVARFVRALLLCACVHAPLLWTPVRSDTGDKLDVWIDGKEVEQFVGVPMDIYVVKDGWVVPYLQDAYFDAQLPILPPEVRLVKISWFSHDALYRYWFSDLRSLDPYTMYNPLLSIPPSGAVPGFNTAFQMSIACTGRVTAVASMYIALHIVDSRGDSIPGSPIKLHLRKRCIAFEKKAVCHFKCKNGGRCNKAGICECKPGYYGPQCKLPICFPVCQNNATCTSPGVCRCLDGFKGEKCEIAICKKPCQNGGTCIGANRCFCPDKFYGQHCRFKKGVCVVGCRNGGTCTSMDKCACAEGYTGTVCQTPVCKRDCGIHGRCYAGNFCKCHRGWRGKRCKSRKKRQKNSKPGRQKRQGRRHHRTVKTVRRRRKVRKRPKNKTQPKPTPK